MLDVVPADGSVLVLINPEASMPEDPARAIVLAIDRLGNVEQQPRRHVIPVCYEPPYAPDLPDVARLMGMAQDELVRWHTSTEFTVAFLGFAPGFGYLSGLPDGVRVPRLASPRTRLPAGSVGLAGPYTGVYALPGPGGWRIIGRTNLVMFDAQRQEPALLNAGDVVQFAPISAEEFAA